MIICLFYPCARQVTAYPAQVNPPEPQLLPVEVYALLVLDPKDAVAEIFFRVSAPLQCGQRGFRSA